MLQEVLKPAAKYYLRPGLCFSSTNNYILPRLQSRLGERAFSYAGPLAWNSLPADLQNIPDTSTFKKRLKTYLFNSVFFGTGFAFVPALMGSRPSGICPLKFCTHDWLTYLVRLVS